MDGSSNDFDTWIFSGLRQCRGSGGHHTGSGWNGGQDVCSGGRGKQAEEIEVVYTHEESRDIIVYYSNGKANGLEKEMVEVDAVTPEQVVSSLSRHNIVSMDTRVLGFEIKEPDAQGRKILGLDLSKAFGEYLKTMGEDCEGVLLAALANTFWKIIRRMHFF